MALTVRDVLELENMKGFRLVAGAGGLDRPVERSGIVDFEFVPEINLDRPAVFDENSFVISSLLFAREDESVLYKAVQSLIDMGVSALAYKNVFFRNISERICQLANRNDFVIFEFDDSAYFEDIIADLSLAIRKDNQLTVLEMKLRELIKQDHSREEVERVAERMFAGFKNYVSVFYCVAKPGSARPDVDRIVTSYGINGKKQNEVVIGRYVGSMMVLVSSDDEDYSRFLRIFEDVLASCGLSRKEFVCSSSGVRVCRSDLDHALRESIYAMQAAELFEKDFIAFHELGTYQFLIPYCDMQYFQRFEKGYLEPLLSMDTEQSKELIKTAIAYVECGGQLKDTASRLFIHENTARYRMNKLREKLAPDCTEFEFFADLSMAVKLYLLKKQ